MTRFVVADMASADEAFILNDLYQVAGPRTARKYRSMFKALYDRLTAHPEIGAPRPVLGSRVRIGIVTPFIAIYQYDRVADTVTLLRLVHGRRRISRALLTTDQTQPPR